MPNGIYPVLTFHQRPSARGSGPALPQRLKSWLRRDHLYEQLARGADLEASAELKRRAEQLVSGTQRAELAQGVERAVREARAHPSIYVSMRRGEVRRCADDLLARAQRLRDERPIDVSGAAMTRRLLTDGASSPLYNADPRSSLQGAVRAARLALDRSRREERPFRDAA